MKDLFRKTIIEISNEYIKNVGISKTKRKEFEIGLCGSTIKELTPEIKSISEKHNIDSDNIHIDSTDLFDYNISATFEKWIPLNESETQISIEETFNKNLSSKILHKFKELGFKRLSVDTRELRAFKDVTLYNLVKDEDWDILVSYYSLYSSTESI